MLFEYAGLGGTGQVRIKYYNIGVFLPQLYQCFAVAVTGRFFITSAMLPHLLQLFHALFVLGIIGGLAVPAHLVFHVADTLALYSLGNDRCRLAGYIQHLWKVSSNAAKSWPSQQNTSKPKARNFSSMG